MARRRKAVSRNKAGVRGPLDSAGTHLFLDRKRTTRSHSIRGGGRKRMGAHHVTARHRKPLRAGFAHR